MKIEYIFREDCSYVTFNISNETEVVQLSFSAIDLLNIINMPALSQYRLDNLDRYNGVVNIFDDSIGFTFSNGGHLAFGEITCDLQNFIELAEEAHTKLNLK